MHIKAKPWTEINPPRRILAIRLQAMGDVVITLPYLQHLRRSLPSNVQLDFLTRAETEDIPKNVLLFDKVFSIGGGRNYKKQLISTFFLLPRLMMRRYDVVIDLQDNTISKIVRKAMFPKAWSVFEKFAPIAAGERNRLTIEAVGLGQNNMDTKFKLKDTGSGITILKNNGWNGTDTLVVLNPAGFFKTRNWNVQNYVRFAQLWLQRFPDTRFLVLGTSLIAEKAAYLQHELNDRLINLIGKTTPYQAFAVLQQATLLLSEDSGLMHMAWVSGIPTITLFGSTRSDWSRPLGDHSFFVDSSDLPCGNCMEAVCKLGDIRCLTRFTPEMMVNQAFLLIQKVKGLTDL